MRYGGEHPLETARGHVISIEQSTTPAGWYTDPAGSGGNRWWDGVQWTAHLQAPTPPPPPAFSVQQPGVQQAGGFAPQQPTGLAPVTQTAVVVQQPQQISPQHVDPYGQANANILPPVQERPYVPMERTSYAPVSAQPVRQAAGGGAIGGVIVGGIAFCLSLVGLMPGSPVFYYSAGGVIAIIIGVRTLLRNRGAYGTPITPIAAIALGSLAVICMVAGILIHTTATASYGTTQATQSQSQGTTTGSQGNSDEAFIPEPPTFPADPALSAYEVSARDMAIAVYGSYSSGHVVGANMNWPTSLQKSPDGTVTLPDGTIAGKLPADDVVRIVVSEDGNYFVIFVSGGADNEIAVYTSKANKFSWGCDTGAPSTCPAGGIPVKSDPTTSNS